MKFKNVKLITALMFGLGLTGLQAQNAIPASGGDVISSGGSVSYTIGQVVYTTSTSVSNGSVAGGVQQPFEISVISGFDEAKSITLQCTAFPNPTTDYFTLKVIDYQLTTLNFQLYDINGKLIETKKVESNETTLDIKNLVPAIYFLKITDNNKELKTFKIIKN